MKSVINKIRLDMTKPKIRTSVSICKGDTNSRQICITLVNSGAVYEIPDRVVAVLFATKADGKTIYNDCSISGNEIIFDVTTQLIASVGDVECQVELSDVDGTILASPVFVIRVYEKLLDSSILESINEYKALTSFCTNAENAALRAEKNALQIDEQLKITGTMISENEESMNAYANRAEQSAINAANSMEDAHNFAVSAGEYADDAKGYADRLEFNVSQLESMVETVQTCEVNASNYAKSAMNDKNASATHASNAFISSANAKASEESAKMYEESSKQNLESCISYCDEASEYADRANNRSVEACEMRNLAEEFRDQAEEFASLSEQSMNTAEISRQNAAISEKNAKEYTEAFQTKVNEIDGTLKAHNDALTDLDTRVSNKMNSIYTSNLGESHITDCQEGDIRNLKMEGRTEQNGTPSPEYPQEINSVELIKVRVCGKNLARLKLGYVWNTDGSLEKYTSDTRIAFQDKIKIDNQGLILSYTYDDTLIRNGVSLCVVYFDENDILTKRITGITSKEYTVDTRYQSFSFFLYTKSNEEKFTANNIHIQLEKGLEVTEYEPYKEQEFTITPPRPLNAIGDYKDICDADTGLWRYALKSFIDSDMAVDVVANVHNYVLSTEETEPINPEDLAKLRALQTYYGTTNLYVTDQDGNDITTWFDYHFNLKPYVEYVKEQISDSKELIYDMQARQLDTEVSNAWAYINSAYAESVADFT